jgi:tetratricopeptide (TPR) repeat protein
MFFNNDDDEDDFEGSFRPLNELIQEFQKAKRGEKNIQLDEEELEFLIDYFESDNDKANIKFAFELGADLFPFSSSILWHKASWLMDQTKYGQALKVLDEIDLIDPKNIESLFLRAEILSETNHDADAIKLLEQNLEHYNIINQCEMLIEMSELYDEMEDFDNVYLTLKRIIQLAPEHEDAMLRICFWADITSMQEDAIELYLLAIDANPFHAVAWYNLGVAYQGLKFFEKAVEAYTTCIDLDENFEYAYRNLGDAHIQLKEFDNAIEVLEKHLSLGNPEDVILEAIAFCWEKKKQYATARNFYRQASQLSPSDDQIFYKIGETYTKEMQWAKAMKSYSAALQLNKNNSVYCMALGNCLMELNSPKEALVLYLNAVRLKPGTKTTWLALVKALYNAEFYDEAISQLLLAESFCGEKPDFIYYRAAIYLAEGKTKEAVLQLEEAMHLAPKKVSVLNQLGKEVMHHPLFSEVIAMNKKKK